jgi:phage shock protein E
MKTKKLIMVFPVAAFFAAMLALEARAELSEADARAQLKRGALVVDVRTVAEFNAKHLTNVVNIPLADLKEKLPGVVTNNGQVVLLHCRSGRRSATAERELRALGYTNAFNLGSFDRAEKIIGSTTR